MSPDQIAGLCASVVVVVGAIAGWYTKGRPRWRRFWARINGTMDAIVGREEYEDTASGRNVPALPPLTNRVATLEEAFVRLTRFEDRVAAVERDVADLKSAAMERIATKAESAQMWRAIADGDPDLLPPSDD